MRIPPTASIIESLETRIAPATLDLAGGVNFQLSADGKTATFNDVDGDLVTVKRSHCER